MDRTFFWKEFIRTGDPVCYLLYRESCRLSETI